MSSANTEMSMDTISSVISSFQQQQKNNTTTVSFPSPFQFYQLGLILYELQQGKEEESLLIVKESYQTLLTQLPTSYLETIVFHDLNQAFIKTVREKSYTGNDDDEQQTQINLAVKSSCTLYHSSALACGVGYSSQLCQTMANLYDETKKCQLKRDRTTTTKSSSQQSDSISLLEELLFQGLSSLIVDGLVLSSKYSNNNAEVHLQTIMELVQALTTDEESTCLGDLQQWQQQQRRQRPDQQSLLQDVIRSKFKRIGSSNDNDDTASQCDYLIQMLQSSPTIHDKQAALKSTATKASKAGGPTTTNTIQKTAPSSTSMSGLDRAIQQIREVLPEMGEGYIETALSCYKGNVSQTISALFEGQANPSSLHPTLQVMDTTLPRRRHETPQSNTHYTLDDDEAKRITKSQVTQMQRQEEEAAYALSIMQQQEEQQQQTLSNTHNEYNDDYDDQYDGLDGGGMTGGADIGMYDVDFNTIKTFNQITREAEKEDSFWDDMRNANRSKSKNNNTKKKESSDNDDQNDEETTTTKKYRGPDKGKGGRAIGPDGRYLPIQKGGKKAKQRRQANQNQTDNDNNSNNNKNKQQQQGKNKTNTSSNAAGGGGGDTSMTKIQKRRKNDNKAKVANHHRKERAQKKTGGF